MPDREMGFGRNGIYSAWHRIDSMDRFLAPYESRQVAMIDIDAALWIEYLNATKEPIALIETAVDQGHNAKPYTVLKNLARRCHGYPPMLAYVVLYKISAKPNPATEIMENIRDIDGFRVNRVWPEPETGFKHLTPAEWAQHLFNLREWYVQQRALLLRRAVSRVI